MKRWRALLSLLLVSLLGCGDDLVTATQVLIRVESDLGPDLALVDTAVFDVREASPGSKQTYAVPAEATLPFTFAVVPAPNKPAKTVLIVVTGRDVRGTLLAQAKALVTFRSNQAVGIVLALSSACLNQECGAMQACTASSAAPGMCRPVEEAVAVPVEPGSVETDASAQDAGSADAAIGRADAATTDGSLPLALDAGDGSLPSMESGDSGKLDADAGRDAGSLASDASVREAGAADAAAASAFPRLDDPVDLSVMGPYPVGTCCEDGVSSRYTNSIVYYPTSATPPFASVAVMQGYAQPRSALTAWGPVLASHGFVSFHVETLTGTDPINTRAEALSDQLALLRGLNTTSRSPLFNKIDSTRFGVLGSEWGGGAALVDAMFPGQGLSAVVAMGPYLDPTVDWQSDLLKITAPTLFLASSNDAVAPPASFSLPFYRGITAPKAHAEFAGVAPSALAKPTDTASTRLVIAWLKIYLERDARYETYFTGPKRQELMPQLKAFMSANR